MPPGRHHSGGCSRVCVFSTLELAWVPDFLTARYGVPETQVSGTDKSHSPCPGCHGLPARETMCGECDGSVSWRELSFYGDTAWWLFQWDCLLPVHEVCEPWFFFPEEKKPPLFAASYQRISSFWKPFSGDFGLGFQSWGCYPPPSDPPDSWR